MTLAPDHEQAIAYLLIEIRDLRVHLERAEEHIAVITSELAGRERRIEELEAALREIVRQVETSGSKGECGWAGEISRKALGSK